MPSCSIDFPKINLPNEKVTKSFILFPYWFHLAGMLIDTFLSISFYIDIIILIPFFVKAILQTTARCEL